MKDVPTIPPGDEEWIVLLKLLQQQCCKPPFKVPLSSGQLSDYYINCKPVILTSKGHRLVSVVVMGMQSMFTSFDMVAGVVLGGAAMASAVAATTSLDAVYVREAPKDHGIGSDIEGPGVWNKRVLILEDVVTTGQSVMKAVQTLRRFDAKIVGVLALVDRLQGGTQLLEAEGIRFRSVFTRHDFMQ